MELRHVRYFLAVAQTRNFTRAAERLGIAQPPLSQQIKALEDELGAPLFRRLPHGAELTEAGAAFLTEAEALMRQTERARRSVARIGSGQIGRVRIGVTGSALYHPRVIETLRRFHARYPEVEVDVVQDDTGVLASSLGDGSLDVAFLRAGPAASDTDATVRFPSERTVAALPSAHPCARMRRIRIARLTGEALLIFPRRAGPSLYDETVAACHRAGFEPRRMIEIPQITAMPSFVAAGLGVAFVPESFAAIALPGVAYVPIAGEGPLAPLMLQPGSASPITARFAAVARDVRDSRVAARAT